MIIYYAIEINKREHYIAKVNEIIAVGEQVRAKAIIDELKSQKTGWLYPKFGVKLDSMRNLLRIDDSIVIKQCVTLDYIKNLSTSNKDILNISNFEELLAVSDDATKLVLCVKYAKSDDSQRDSCQAILLDVDEHTVNILTPKTKSWHYSFKSAFSPSGKTVVISVDGRRYYFSSQNNSTIDISNGFYPIIDDLVMQNDSVYYFTSWGSLYKASINLNEQPEVINKSEKMWHDLTMISDNIIGCTGNWHEIIIYNELEDSVYFHSNQRHIGSLRGVNKDYAITSKGLFDIEKDTIVIGNHDFYDYKGTVVKLQNNGGQYSLVDLNDKEVINVKTDEGLRSIRFSKDGKSLISYSDWSISIYGADSDWKLSDIDRKTFDLK